MIDQIAPWILVIALLCIAFYLETIRIRNKNERRKEKRRLRIIEQNQEEAQTNRILRESRAKWNAVFGSKNSDR